MNIVLPIVFGAFVLGIVVRRMTWREWVGLGVYILAVLAWYWIKNK